MDVGQGDATLVISPTGRTLLIDAGYPGMGTSVVLPFLESEGINGLDWVIPSHYDSDHIGGLPEVLRGEDGELAFLDRGEATDKSTPAYLDYLESVPKDRRTALPGQILNLGGGATATVVVVPIILPIALAFGVDPVHLGIIFLANLELGYMTPPVGMNLFLASYRFNKPLTVILHAVSGIFWWRLLGVLAITYMPWLSTWLPSLWK